MVDNVLALPLCKYCRADLQVGCWSWGKSESWTRCNSLDWVVVWLKGGCRLVTPPHGVPDERVETESSCMRMWSTRWQFFKFYFLVNYYYKIRIFCSSSGLLALVTMRSAEQFRAFALYLPILCCMPRKYCIDKYINKSIRVTHTFHPPSSIFWIWDIVY